MLSVGIDWPAAAYDEVAEMISTGHRVELGAAAGYRTIHPVDQRTG
jgi:hypothetical protein